MKNFFLLTAFITLVSFSFTSCKKKDKVETTTEKVQHKWTLVNVVSNSHDSGGDHIITIPGSAGDYVDFNSNGTYTSLTGGTSDSGNYSVVSDSQISIDGDVYTIKTLTSAQFVLYLKDETSATEYDEATINLSR